MAPIEDIIKHEWQNKSISSAEALEWIGRALNDPATSDKAKVKLAKLIDEVVGMPSEPAEMTDAERELVKEHYNGRDSE